MGIREVPEFETTEEESRNPIQYINSIRKFAERYGICNIKMKDFRPPFSLDLENFRFTPRIQRLKELDAKTRVKIYFCNQLTKFWKFHGVDLEIPDFEGNPLDFYKLHQIVSKLGGYEAIRLQIYWKDVADEYKCQDNKNGQLLKKYYERSLLPFDKYINSVNETPANLEKDNQSKSSYKKSIAAKSSKPKKSTEQEPVCNVCETSDEAELILICCSCDQQSHIDCLQPPIKKLPECDWTCPRCLRNEIFNPKEGFGMQDSDKEYTIEEFKEKADDFKANYFGCAPHHVKMIPLDTVEDEYWKITSNSEENVVVEYGTDIHTLSHGSAFPTKLDESNSNKSYVDSKWNLNNLPLSSDCVLSYIEPKIDGITVPWLYVGMCFSTFCWHIEDHWISSINYLHCGAPKTWYAVPPNFAKEFEKVMKEESPELFESQPDLLHQLVTTLNPEILVAKKIPVYRVHQQPGTFVVTFPRTYHMGFNQGFNVAEAVNFATGNWIPMGRQSLENYSLVKRVCVFSHDELIMNMAKNITRISPNTITPCFNDFINMLHQEHHGRKQLFAYGIEQFQSVLFEELPDDLRKCNICNTTLFLSSIACKVCDVQSCLRHYKELCSCSHENLYIKSRFTLVEMVDMIRVLVIKIKSFEKWLSRVRLVTDPNPVEKISFQELKNLINTAKQNGYLRTKLVDLLEKHYEEANKCEKMIEKLKVHLYRVNTCGSSESEKKFDLEEIDGFIDHLQKLPCVLTNFDTVKEVQQVGTMMKLNIKKFLEVETIQTTDPDELKKFVEDVELTALHFPELKQLKSRLEQVNWYSSFMKYKVSNVRYSLLDLQDFLIRGLDVAPDYVIESEIAQIHTMTQRALEWNDRTKLLIESDSEDLKDLDKLEKLLEEAKEIPIALPTYDVLKEIFMFEYEKTTVNVTDLEPEIDHEEEVECGKLEELPIVISVQPDPSTSCNTTPIVIKNEPTNDASGKIKGKRGRPRKESCNIMYKPSMKKLKRASDTDDSDEICAHLHCKKPYGSPIDWICCDECNRWFHVVCIGWGKKVIKPNLKYKCVYCQRGNKSKQKTPKEKVPKEKGSKQDKTPKILLDAAAV